MYSLFSAILYGMDPKEVGLGGGGAGRDWIDLAQDRDRWRAL
jgi:hypothetical protein